ncbi:hypothetical protein KUTeg_021165 [Tegillarca granosa]|uniref:HTH CENPB-type domain-containing protein n=1 Tax=Tegillarca granosa TaxID=220873 RepID=A0ABQ9EA04_TEGGR|nr:hypothetical protein KUTeg_021165 [Tegillarca granosa]
MVFFIVQKVKKNILQIKIQIKAVNGERKRRKYDDSDLKSAINSVKEKTLSIREASKLYKIPKSTIQDCLAQNRSKTKAPGRQNSLNHTQETSLVNYINYMSKRGFPLSLKTMKYYVGAIVQKNNKIRVNFKHREPSNEWCRKFLKKHNLSLRTPEELSLAHTYVTEKIVSEYFNLLKQTITNLNIEEKPSQIYNMDEIGWGPGNKKRRKVIVQKGVAHPIQQQSLIVDHISALICGNAEGRLIPPSIIFKESLPLKLDDAPENWSYVATNNAFSSKEVFAEWMKKCFIPNCGRARPVLLLLDNSITHFSIEAIELAVENQIELMGFPPNCTPWAQPMDQIFQHLRQAVEEVAIALRMVNTNSTLSKNNFSLVLKYALPRGLTKSRVSGAFKSCGIFHSIHQPLTGLTYQFSIP